MDFFDPLIFFPFEVARLEEVQADFGVNFFGGVLLARAVRQSIGVLVR